MKKPTKAQLAKKLSKINLSFGAHGDKVGYCAREALCYVMTGTKEDETPECLSRCLVMLPDINDGPFKNNAARTRFFKPWWSKLLELRRDARLDEKRTFAVVNAYVREVLPVGLCAGPAEGKSRSARLSQVAKVLKGLPAIDCNTYNEAEDKIGEVWKAAFPPGSALWLDQLRRGYAQAVARARDACLLVGEEDNLSMREAVMDCARGLHHLSNFEAGANRLLEALCSPVK